MRAGEKALNELAYVWNNECDDNEKMHAHADDILIDFIRELGYKEIADLYDTMAEHFWYAWGG